MKLLIYFFVLHFVFGYCVNTSAQCTLTATSSSNNSAYSQVYILVDASGNIVAENTTGNFANVASGSYTIHALNYDPFNAPVPLPSVLIGQPLNLVGSVVNGCYNADLLTDFVNRSCGSCQQSSTVCETDPVVATSSGNNATYTQLYVLVNAATSLVVATNTTGNFTGLVTAGNSYRIYALNYNPIDAPAPLPTVGQDVNLVGSTNLGCFNADFFTDYVCFNITSCATSCVQNNDVCENTSISVSSSGNNSTYVQVYVLADDLGNFITQNTSGNFSTVGFPVGNTYHVHALNYDPSNPPAPLPAALSVGAALSSISGGCFNTDFLSDYVCYTIIACPPACFQQRNVCEDEAIIVNSSGSMPGYIQVYVLADDLGNFIAQNSTGVFATTSLTVGNTYHVHALNYDPLNPPAPLPVALAVGAPLSSITGGCYNADFLSDYLCYTIGCPCDAKLVQYAPNQSIPGIAGSVAYTVANAYCDDVSGWRYYYDPTNPNDLLFAIQHKPVGGNTNDFTARVTLGVNDYSTTTGYDEPVGGQDLAGFNAQFAMGRYWDVDVLSGSLNGNVNIRFYYKEAEYNTTAAAATNWRQTYEPAAQVAGYDGLSLLAPFWFKTNDATAYDPIPDVQPTTINSGNVQQLAPDFIGTNAAVITNNKNYVQFNNQIASFSGGTVAFRVVPDPIILASGLLEFDGHKQGDDNFLHWSFETETAIDYFVLERSADGINSEELISYNSSGGLHYAFVDNDPLSLSYYRLKIVNNDGSFDYSNWVVLDRTLDQNDFRVYPNPTEGGLTLDFVSAAAQPINIVISDVLGRTVLQRSLELSAGQNKTHFDISELSSAVYVLTIGQGAQKIVRKITKL